jgi:squalene-associated FAD-dependent desaturase
VKIAVIGAGWAGLAAAHALKLTGLTPTVFEAAPLPGGRARRVDDQTMGAIDNGQHLLIGAYTETLKLIHQLQPHRDEESLFLRSPLRLESANGKFCLHAPRLPSPLHALYALLSAKGLNLSQRWHALQMIATCKLKQWRSADLQTVEQLLDCYHQNTVLRQYLWHPLCLATLNTPPQQACAQLFLNVLRDSLDAPAKHSDLIVPRVDLTALWPALAAEGMDMRYRHIVREVLVASDHVSVDTERFDACVIAVPPYAVSRILRTTTHSEPFSLMQSQLQLFTYRPIATLTLQLKQDWQLPRPVMMLDENPALGHYGQWVFERKEKNQLTVVVSDAEDFLKHERNNFVRNIAEQIRQQVSQHALANTQMPDVTAHRLIVEKRATFNAIPGLARPANKTIWPRLTLAGDWTDTGYPAVLEGAVRSGQRAAAVLLAQGIARN